MSLGFDRRVRGLLVPCLAAAAVVLAALPASVSSSPVGSGSNYYSAPATYEAPAYSPPQYSSYEPSYSAPAPYQPQPEYYQPPKQSYQPAYSPAPSYEPSYSPPVYTPPPYYPEYVKQDPVQYYELNDTIQCGVIPAVNEELYKSSYGYQQPEYGYGKGSSVASNSPVAPFGKNRWIAIITDEYNNFLCQGTLVSDNLVLTVSSCVSSYAADKLRVRFGDWDIQNDNSDYEAYKNVEVRICKQFPISCYFAKYSTPTYSSYGYGQQQQQQSSGYGYKQQQSGSYVTQETELVLLQTEGPDRDVYPHVQSICLPEYPEKYQESYSYAAPTPSYSSYSPPKASYSSYSAPAPSSYSSYESSAAAPYQPPSYQQQSGYGYEQSYTPAYSYVSSYEPKTYEIPYEYYSECYVVGYYGSPTTKVAQKQQESYGYGSTPSYNSYSSDYNSKTPRSARVKQVKCEYGYGQGQGSQHGQSGSGSGSGYGSGYEKSCSENICFVGEYGEDACVADRGAAVVCVVPEKVYDYGYASYDTPDYYQSESYGYKQDSYKKEIISAAAPEVYRKRAVVVAVVDYPAQCTASSSYKPQQYGYGYKAQQEYTQTKPLVAIKVTDKVTGFIQAKFYEGIQDGYTSSCPAPKTYYAPEPEYYSPPQYSSYEAPAYSPPQYSPPKYEAPAYSPPQYSPPKYEAPAYSPPQYSQPKYEAPAYSPPKYEAPAYSPPQYSSYEAPAYSPPKYEAPAYSPPQYSSYEAPAYSPPQYSPPKYEAPAYSPPKYY